MIEFDQGDPSPVEFIFTLTENVTEAEPVYDFTFTHVLTKQQVTFSRTVDDDTSTNKDRYNSFMIDTAQFTQAGEWHYTVTEEQTGVVLEYGKMIITRAFNYNMYDSATSYSTYNG
jgi:hypothetical protein